MGVDLASEEQFGPYLVYERVGVGGMATVHRALERGIEGFERIVALKRLLPHLAEDASFIKSFVREAKLAALLNHNNVVQIFELGRVGAQYFISMEYIDGRDIRAILRHARKVTGPPPIHVTVGLLLQLCDALDYAHTKTDDEGQPLGLVHRDVSPSNVLVTSAGHVKVIDFGIAKAQSQQLRTQTGRVKGKLAYMAPEAISGGRDLDARSDLFAVGVIAHELLTARPLFASKNEYQTLLKVQRGDISAPSMFNGACPPELDAIVLKALARDPDDRYPSAGDVRDDLLRLKFAKNLSTSHRDIAQWLDWAASVETPGAFGAAHTVDRTGGTSKVHKTPTPRPVRQRREDEEEAVEIAWGGGGDQEVNEPVLLDDVPDVSDKHLAPTAAQLGAAPHDLDDDIPAPQPSHGARPSRALPIPAPPEDDDDPRSHPAIARKPASVPPGQRFGAGYGGPERRTPSSFATPPAGVVDRRAPTAPPPPPSERRGPDRRIISAGPPDGVERRLGDRRATTTGRRDAVAPIGSPASTNERIERLGTSGEAPPRSARSLTDQLAASALDDPQDTHRQLPAVRFSGATGPVPLEPSASATLLDSAVPSTKPGFAPPRNVTRADAPNLVAHHQQQRPPTDVSIGSAIMARQSVRKTWVLFAGLGVSGAIAAAIALYVTRTPPSTDRDVAPAAGAGMSSAKRERALVKFIIEPADSEIAIHGMEPHVGSPWQTELPPGVHSIQIQRTGHKAYLTSLELSANETQTLRVVLEQLGSQPGDQAMLSLSSSPPGLEAMLDGQLLAQRTPIKMPIAPGPHTLVLRQNGVEVWRQQMVAKASSDYVFNPSMAVDKQRERAQRTSVPPVVVEPVATPVVTPPVAPAAPPVDAGVKPTAPLPTPTPLPVPVKPTPPPPIAVAPQPQPQPKPKVGPQLVAPNQVTRLSGATPNIPKSKRADLPPVITAKVCIDVSGRVTTVAMISKLERHTSIDLTNAIRTWTYKPYALQGVAVPACFVVNFRVAD